MILDERIPPRLATQLVPIPWSGCWVWIGRLNRNGYGYTWWKGKERVVHRIVWTLLRGEIPADKILDHLRERCYVRCCANPDHLEPVTPKENTWRGAAVLYRRLEE